MAYTNPNEFYEDPSEPLARRLRRAAQAMRTVWSVRPSNQLPSLHNIIALLVEAADYVDDNDEENGNSRC